MPVKRLFEINGIDLRATQVDYHGIQKLNKHRGKSQLLDRIVWLSEDFKEGIAARLIRDDEWWVPGHIPGEPILPGVLLVEAAAQLASYMYLSRTWKPFCGFTGIDNTKFRNRVVPGDEVFYLCKEIKFSERRFISDAQGWVNDTIAFETRITGMSVLKADPVITDDDETAQP